MKELTLLCDQSSDVPIIARHAFEVNNQPVSCMEENPAMAYNANTKVLINLTLHIITTIACICKQANK